MLSPTASLLEEAQKGRYAIGAFNVYNLEGVLAVIGAAEAEGSPVMLQVHPSAVRFGGRALIDLCLAAARASVVPTSVHLDHSSSEGAITLALNAGVSSIMADGSHLSYEDNMAFTGAMCALAGSYGAAVEAELGRLTGTEDGLSVPEYEAKLTDPSMASDFARRTGIHALAVCIGNVHGYYRGEPRLDFDRLAAIRERVKVPLVLHGASGLPDELVRRSVELGVCKFNVNTEVRDAYTRALKKRFDEAPPPDLIDLMGQAVSAMREVVAAKLRLFGSVGRV
jgi:tagatose 1,6-diphosphate aldolase GatY/KbaY